MAGRRVTNLTIRPSYLIDRHILDAAVDDNERYAFFLQGYQMIVRVTDGKRHKDKAVYLLRTKRFDCLHFALYIGSTDKHYMIARRSEHRLNPCNDGREQKILDLGDDQPNRCRLLFHHAACYRIWSIA